MKLTTILTVVLLGLFVMSAASASNVECQTDNPELLSMPLSKVTFTRPDGSLFELQARTANTNKNRAAGFQRVCAQTIAAMPMLFVFDNPVVPSFHMHNVVAGIDIAFIQPDGVIDSIQKMTPYVLMSLNKPLYSSNNPVIVALEAHPDFFKKHNIDVHTTFSWELN